MKKLHVFMVLVAGVLPLADQQNLPPIAPGAAELAPRTHLPPDTDDPNRPPNVRLLKAGVWTDDVGVDDNGNVYIGYTMLIITACR